MRHKAAQFHRLGQIAFMQPVEYQYAFYQRQQALRSVLMNPERVGICYRANAYDEFTETHYDPDIQDLFRQNIRDRPECTERTAWQRRIWIVWVPMLQFAPIPIPNVAGIVRIVGGRMPACMG